jgi:hypothetical protein
MASTATGVAKNVPQDYGKMPKDYDFSTKGSIYLIKIFYYTIIMPIRP